MLRMNVTDVDKDLTDRFPIFAEAVENHINKTFANLQKTDFFASSEEHDDEVISDDPDELDYFNPEETCPFWAYDNAPRGA